MDLAFSTNKMQYLKRTFSEVRHQEEMTEIVVPDSYPDVASISDCFASVFLRGKECRTGSVSVSGAVKAGALYVPEDDTFPRLLEFYIPFTVRFDSAAFTDTSQILTTMKVCSVDARMINSRKVMLRVNIGCHITAFINELQVCHQLQSKDDRLQCKKNELRISLPVELEERTFSVGDSLEITGGRPPVVQICKVRCSCNVTDQKLVGNKAVFKGSLHCKILYRSDNDGLYLWTHQIPFSQYCDLQRDYDEDDLSVFMSLTGCDVDLDGAESTSVVHLTVNILAQCVVSSRFELDLTEDAYCVRGQLEPEWTQYTFECLLDQRREQLMLRHQIRGDIREVLDAEIYEGYPSWHRKDQGLEASVPVNIRVCGVDEAGRLISLQSKADLTAQYALSEDASCAMIAWQADLCTAQIMGDGAEVRCELETDISFTAPHSFQNLCGATIHELPAEAERRPSVIMKAIRQEQALWDIAKTHGTTVAALQRANHITSDYTQDQGMLLIPVE